VRYAKIVECENVIAGTDCGLGGRIHPQIAWAKLQALSEGARLATKELWV
jgi:5-methyltetrahydropteroyltriglutamate--homocysteine methyltransferase